MRRFPEPIQNLVAALTRLPGVGPKTALRYVYALLKQPPSDLINLSNLVRELGDKIDVCRECFTYTEGGSCELCRDPKRDPYALCVVEASRDIATIEATNAFNGRYFVLGGTLDPIEGMTPEALNVRALLDKLAAQPEIEEIILAFSPDVHGETTMMYLTKIIKQFSAKGVRPDDPPVGRGSASGGNRRVTRLARGLPLGASLEFADEVTLGDAMKGRRETEF